MDASHNHLLTLDGLKGTETLKYLDVSWNQLTYIKEEIGVLRKHASDLLTLDLRHNPWKKVFFIEVSVIKTKHFIKHRAYRLLLNVAYTQMFTMQP